MEKGQGSIKDALWERFSQSAQTLGFAQKKNPRGQELREVFEELAACYEDPRRTYYNFAYLSRCLTACDNYKDFLKGAPCVDGNPSDMVFACIDMALFYHRAVFDPTRTDNAARSVALFLSSVPANGCGKEISDLIEVTACSKPAFIGTAQRPPAPRPGVRDFLMIDITRGDLGAPLDSYRQDAADIRGEYLCAGIEEKTYRKGRKRAVSALLGRAEESGLYHLEFFKNLFNQRALENLAAELKDGPINDV